MSTTAVNSLPRPSRVHATCAWCRVDFPTIVELIDHVDHGHAALPSESRPRRSNTRETSR